MFSSEGGSNGEIIEWKTKSKMPAKYQKNPTLSVILNINGLSIQNKRQRLAKLILKNKTWSTYNAD